jgi:two-component system, NtrC family, sensor kinase
MKNSTAGSLVHRRLTVAGLRSRASLRVRFALAVAAAVAFVIAAAGYFQTRTLERMASDDLLETARLTALAVADELELRQSPPADDDPELVATLHEFIEAAPVVRNISIVSGDAAPHVIASTSSEERADAIALARRAIDQREAIWDSSGGVFRSLATPYLHGRDIQGAVVVTVSIATIRQIEARGRTVTLWVGLAAIVLLLLLVDLATRRLIHRPIEGITQTMNAVSGGDLSVRAPVRRDDEIGRVASGLNDMLERMENFNDALKTRVREATSELQARNEELIDTHYRVFMLREALARAEQMAAVGQMAANVAHQIGTPLNLISGYVQVIRDEAPVDGQLRRRLEIVEEQIARVTSVLRSLLDHARQPSPMETTDPARLIGGVCDLARPKLERSGVKLDVQVPRDLPQIRADVVQLELALLNLIGNGVDAMPSGGTLTVRVSQTPSGVRFEVADTGTGIAADLLPRIFDPWVTTKAPGRGSGLGLSIARDVITAHGGTIAVHSEPGTGTVFTVDLPAAAVEVTTS